MSVTPQPDLGTPARISDVMVTVHVDGREVTVPEGTSVMRAAALAGIDIPSLCATDRLEPHGSCRLCVVEVDSLRGTPASCTTPCTDTMRITTTSPRLDGLRRGVMELYLSDHPHDRDACASTGCAMHGLADRLGADASRYPAGRTHLGEPADASNPYFAFDPAECIRCDRCVRVCGEVQGTFALTVSGRGFDGRITAGLAPDLLASACVSCGACVDVCPTGALVEHAVRRHGLPERAVDTTCAYCGVGCAFQAQMRGDELVRMVPLRDGGANAGHSCVKGRFAFGYADHPDRRLHPMVRDTADDPWRTVGWDEALDLVASRFTALQAAHGPGAIGGITSSRTTNEEVYAVQKMVRGAFGNNNVDTCARVCHSPTGYGLGQTFGTSAGTQDFASVDAADVILVIGANPTDAHPVFGARLKRRVRAGASLIVADPRRIDLVRTPHVRADHHLQLLPGTNVALINAMAHTIVTEGLADHAFLRDRCEGVPEYLGFIAGDEHSAERASTVTGVPAADIRAAARRFAAGPNSAIYYGLGVTEHSQGSTMVMGMANLAMLTGSIGRPGVGVNPLRGQNNVQGSCDMGSFPHELPGYRHVARDEVRGVYEALWGRTLDPTPGLRIPNMLDAAVGGSFRGIYIQGEDIAQSDPNTRHVTAALESMDCVVVHDLFLNETARFAHVFLPGTSFLEKDGTFTNAERRINRVRPVMPPRCGMHEWEVVCEIARRMGFPMSWPDSAAIMDEVAATTPTFSGVSHAMLDATGSVQWPCTADAPNGTPIMHVDGFVRGRGRLVATPYVPTTERTTRRFPLILTTGRTLTQYNVGAQTRRTPNTAWHAEDVLEMHPSDAADRGIPDGGLVEVASRVGVTHLHAHLVDRVPPGVVYTTFHHPESGANVVTTENSDWATNCPEYKVTAVQVSPAAHLESGTAVPR